MESKTFFPYSWHEDKDEENTTVFRIFGLDENNKSVCVKVTDFTPYVYLELPSDRKWNSTMIRRLSNTVDELCGHDDTRRETHDGKIILGCCAKECRCIRPLKKSISHKHKLYYANSIKKEGVYSRQKFPFLLLAFSNKSEINKFGYKIRYPVNIQGIGKVQLKMHEQDAKPILQFVCIQDIQTCGWIKIYGRKKTENKETLCVYEYNVKYKNFKKHEKEENPNPYVLSFDIEVNSTNPNRMPDPEIPGDKVFQISCVFSLSLIHI